MKIIEIKTQAQFDKLPSKFKFYTEIKIVGCLENLNRTPENSFMSVSGSATIEYVSDSATIESVSGSATIEYVYGSATIEYVSDSATIKSVYGSATIKSVSGSATIEHVSGSATIKSVSGSATIKSVYGSATIKSVYGSATIKSVSGSATIEYVSDSATIEYVSDSATIESVSDSATIKSVSGSATIKSVYGSATIKSVSGSATIEYVYGSATIEYVYGSATIEYVYGSATIESVYDSATIEYVSMNVIIRIMSKGATILEARQQVVVVYQGCKGKPKICDKTVTVKHTVKADFSLPNFINIYGVKKIKTKLTLYKFVQSNFTDFYTGEVKYKIGQTIECPDWNDDKNNECGGGLHLSPTIKDCKRFNNSKDGHALKCEVDIKDIVVHPNPQYPYKVRCRRVKVIEEIKE